MFKCIKNYFINISCFCLAGCTFTADNSKINENTDNQNTYVKSVFIAYYELSEFTKNSDKKSFTKSISKAFKELSNKGFNRVTVQVRPCADAFTIHRIFLQANIALAIKVQSLFMTRWK